MSKSARGFTTTRPLETLGCVVSKAASAPGNCRNDASTCAVVRVVELAAAVVELAAAVAAHDTPSAAHQALSSFRIPIPFDDG